MERIRALIYGQESHVTGDFIEYCRNNNIELFVDAAFVSHENVTIFGPLKKVVTAELRELMQTEVSRIQNAEWLAAYVRARTSTFTEWNIHSAFSLIRFYPNKVIHRIATSSSLPSGASTPENPSSFNNPNLTSSPVDMMAYSIDLIRVR